MSEDVMNVAVNGCKIKYFFILRTLKELRVVSKEVCYTRGIEPETGIADNEHMHVYSLCFKLIQ